MKSILLFLSLVSVSTAVAEKNLCASLFSKQTSQFSKEVQEAIASGIPDQIITAFIRETAVIENKLTDSDVAHLVVLARQVLKDKSINDKTIYEMLYYAKKKYDAEIDAQLKDMGQMLNQSVRNMRLRRERFALALNQGDALKAAHVYRDLYESYFISLSYLKAYITGDRTTRNEGLVKSARFVLMGLTQTARLKDLAVKVRQIYAEKNPSPEAIVDVFDQIVARTNDEYRYAEWYVSRLEKDPEISQAMKDNLKYIRGRLSVDTIAERFKMDLLAEADLTTAEASQIVSSRPQILVYWLRHIRQIEKQYARRIMIRSIFHVENFRKFVNHIIPEAYRGPISKLIGLDYNTYVTSLHFENLEAVLLAPKGQPQLDAFREAVAEGDSAKSAQFLETLARLSNNMDTWNDLKTQVSTLANQHANYKVLLNMMVAAEGKIETLGFISRLDTTSKFDHYSAWVLPGATTAAGAAYWNWDTLVSWYRFSVQLAVQNWPF
ncbi:MAG: hypothetical protein K2Q26_11860 [Bdellovibrionales bacterium]|nr:hypothetical protein [Bdellovibrionales bacterium]